MCRTVCSVYAYWTESNMKQVKQNSNGWQRVDDMVLDCCQNILCPPLWSTLSGINVYRNPWVKPCWTTSTWHQMILGKLHGTRPCTWLFKPSTTLWRKTSASLCSALRSVRRGSAAVSLNRKKCSASLARCDFEKHGFLWFHPEVRRWRFAGRGERAEWGRAAGWAGRSCCAEAVLHGPRWPGAYQRVHRRTGSSGSHQGELCYFGASLRLGLTRLTCYGLLHRPAVGSWCLSASGFILMLWSVFQKRKTKKSRCQRLTSLQYVKKIR